MTERDDSTRTQILAHAKTLFAAQGYDGTSVRDIVNAAGVNVSLVSYHFGGKDGLYRECIKQAGTTRLAIAKECLTAPSSADDVATKIRIYVERSLGAIANDLETQKIIGIELDLGRSFFSDILEDVFLKIHETVATFMAAAQAKNLVRADMDARLVASMIQGLITNEARVEKIRRCYFDASIVDTKHRAECAHNVSELILNGVFAPRVTLAR